MELSPETISEIEQIITTFKCSLDYRCYALKFEELCGAIIFGDGEMIECIDKNAANCQFSAPFGEGYFCDCPLRAYVAKKLKV
ncbi:MAG: hypothetical protein DRP52_03460 [Planctomycetota bacterium]|nr:MAG: hypothetical protein DRP52_03460 [Planctomycetota bacterium]